MITNFVYNFRMQKDKVTSFKYPYKPSPTTPEATHPGSYNNNNNSSNMEHDPHKLHKELRKI